MKRTILCAENGATKNTGSNESNTFKCQLETVSTLEERGRGEVEQCASRPVRMPVAVRDQQQHTLRCTPRLFAMARLHQSVANTEELAQCICDTLLLETPAILLEERISLERQAESPIFQQQQLAHQQVYNDDPFELSYGRALQPLLDVPTQRALSQHSLPTSN